MNTKINQLNKQVVTNFWQELETSEVDTLSSKLNSTIADDLVWHGPDPIYELYGFESFIADFWQPLQKSFSGLTRQTHLFVSGESNGRVDGDFSLDGRMWVSGTGYLNGVFKENYLGIPATGSEVNIRWGEFCRLEEGKIVEIFCLLDYIDLMQQVGVHVLPPSNGTDGIYPRPSADDGLLHNSQDDSDSEYSLEHIRKFIFDGLNSYDQSNLKSMGMADYFHEDVQWYGPGGIGACLSFKEFEDNHQQHWLKAFPDRQVQNLDALIAEGMYSGGPGWAGVKATHTGQYLDSPATGNSIEFNGLDWWKREGEEYIENWVFVDMVHLYRQFGIDLFARMEDH